VGWEAGVGVIDVGVWAMVVCFCWGNTTECLVGRKLELTVFDIPLKRLPCGCCSYGKAPEVYASQIS